MFLNKKDLGLHSSSGNYELQSFGQVGALISLVIKMEMKILMLQDCLKFKTNVCVCVHACVSTRTQLCPALCNPMDCSVACHAPLSTGFPRQEYWSGLPFPSPGDLPDPGVESMSPAA